MVDERTSVLVVGAGLAGAATAMFLAGRGVDVLLVEKHASTSVHPRAAGQYPHTMELLHTAGVEDAILDASRGREGGLVMKIVATVGGEVFQTISHGTRNADTAPFSPRPWGLATQDRVEPIMLDRARDLGGRVRLSTELVSFEQDDDGVTARLLDRWNGRLSTVRADYLVAADGHRSPIRAALGIERDGRGGLSNAIGVIFEADLSGLVDPDAAVLYYLNNPEFTAVFAGVDGGDRYLFSFEYHPERGELTADYPPERIVALLRAALGRPDLEPTLLSVRAWEIAAWVSRRFSSGRVFLAGDSAKVTPPTGGLGGNTAIGDGFDLAWKLAEVLTGAAGPGLLDSYDAERRPFAAEVVNTSLHQAKERTMPDLDLAGTHDPVDVMALAFGFRRRSGAVLAEDDTPGLADDPARPTGRPGVRAPHVPLVRDGAQLSTVDLFGTGWVLLAGEGGGVWAEAARHVADRLDVDLTAHTLGPELADPTGSLARAYGIGVTGASLVRPDGVVAWRCDREPTDAAAALLGALAAVLDRRVPVHAA